MTPNHLIRQEGHLSLKQQSGSMLLEVALVLLITGVLTMATIGVHSAMQKRRQDESAEQVLAAVNAAVRAFVLREHRMPCPDSANTGWEAIDGGGACTANVGAVPFAALGMEVPKLSQGIELRYGVAQRLAAASPASLSDGTEAMDLRSLAMKSVEDPLSTNQVHLAGRDAQGLFSQCGRAALNPAYALMWLPRSIGPSTTPLCFEEREDRSMGLLAVGQAEFLGWYHAAQGTERI